ncbi:hypothetical protein [Priestia abyssalis]|uniref:hypothetical protein n=1 Tax=Priestia abyssalis TaxID=1221450 RepID=UPI00099525EB|nr:hypothetical protein [Priestia abyssalis]
MPIIKQTCDGKTRTYFISTTPVDFGVSVINTGSCPFKVIVVRAEEDDIVLEVSPGEEKEIINTTSLIEVQIKCLKCDCGTCCEGLIFVGF